MALKNTVVIPKEAIYVDNNNQELFTELLLLREKE